MPDTLLERLLMEKQFRLHGGIYHKLQIDMAYNSNRIEGSSLSHEQTRFIWETQTIAVDNSVTFVDDIVETLNHFQCLDYLLETIDESLSENLIKEFHRILKTSTMWSRVSYNIPGGYKVLPNQVGGMETTEPEDVEYAMETLLFNYNWGHKKDLRDILDFHVRFEQIHPFQDGNGRVGRLILFREALRNHIAPFIIVDSKKIYYSKGIAAWHNDPTLLMEVVRSAQGAMLETMRYFRIQSE